VIFSVNRAATPGFKVSASGQYNQASGQYNQLTNNLAGRARFGWDLHSFFLAIGLEVTFRGCERKLPSQIGVISMLGPV